VFSFPAVFVLGGIGLTLIGRSAAAGRFRAAIGWIAVSSLWIVAFLALYLMVYRGGANSVQRPYYENAGYFAPFPPRSIAQIKWYYDTFVETFHLTTGRGFPELASVLFLFGVYILAARGEGPLLGMLIFPLLLALAASAMKRYPFMERLLLFSSPMLVTVIAAGVTGVPLTEPSTRFLRRLLVAMLLLYPTYMTVKTLTMTVEAMDAGAFGIHDVKPALDQLADRWQEGDMIYVHYGAGTLYDYYVNVMNYKNLRGKPVVIGASPGRDDFRAADPTDYEKDVERVQGRKRVWFLFAMETSTYLPQFEHILDARGVRLYKFQAPTSGALLYDLSGSQPIAFQIPRHHPDSCVLACE
jgi:hypothetical protein